MRFAITRFQIYILTWIANKIVIQSSEHRSNVIIYYSVIVKAARRQFTEDNKPTLDAFLTECHRIALDDN